MRLYEEAELEKEMQRVARHKQNFPEAYGNTTYIAWHNKGKKNENNSKSTDTIKRL